MKIKISEIENKLTYKLKRNFKSVGVDTAQITGLCFLTTDKVWLHIDSMCLGFKTKDHKEIYESMVKTFEKLFQDENLAIVEDVFIGFNKAGCLELARYGSFAIAECIKKDIPYEIIKAVSARAKFKINTRKYGTGKSKLAVADFVKELGLDLKDDNIVDAFVLALCGLCEGIDFSRPIKKKKKRKVAKKTIKKSIKKGKKK